MSSRRRVPLPQFKKVEQLDNASVESLEVHLAWELTRLVRAVKDPANAATRNQAAFAEKVCDVSPPTLSRWMHNTNTMPLDRAAMIDRAFGEPTSLGITFADLRSRIDRVPEVKVRHDIFLAAPMASIDSAAYPAERAAVLNLARVITEETQRKVFFAGRDIESTDDFDPPDFALKDNLSELRGSRCFVMLALKPLTRPSGIFVEAGMALALQIPSLYVVKDESCLPFPLRKDSHDGGGHGLPKVEIRVQADYEAATKMFRKGARRIFKSLAGQP